MFNAPQPRSRLYTQAGDYALALAGGGGEARLQALEAALAEAAPGIRAIAVPMARVGIYLALKHLIAKGQKVILSSYTISDVVNMVLCAGGVPLFVDIAPDGSCNIDAEAVVRLLASERDVGAVLVTHFYGLVCDIAPIAEACARHGVPLVEDAAQAFGALDRGRPAGTLADAGVFSFGLLKNVTSFMGGAVLTRDEGLERKIRAEIAGYPIASRRWLLPKLVKGAVFDIATFPPVFDTLVYWLFRTVYLHNLKLFKFFSNQLDTDANPVARTVLPAGYAHRMSPAQARILSPQLARHGRDSEERIAKARLYHEGLSDISGLTLPPLRADGSHIYLNYAIQCEDRDGLARAMTRKGRDVQVSHHRNCASMECFRAYKRDCPNAERAERSMLYLPLYPGYREDQVRANIEAIRSHFREGNTWR